jgi:hypothetical protein
VLAATNRLIEALGVSMPTEAYSDERSRYRVNPIPARDLLETSMPQPAMGPPASMASGASMAPAAAAAPEADAAAPVAEPTTADAPVPSGGR